MEIQQIRYFLAICETLNFTRAAERCAVAQPSLTRAVKQLEDELGGPLFRRERNNTHLTDLGRLMLPHLQRALSEMESAAQRARGMSDTRPQRLRLGVMCTIAPARLVGLLRDFRRQHPRVTLELRDGGARDLERRLLADELDVAIYGLPGEPDAALESQDLFSERFVIVFAPGHPFERLDAVRMADLDGHTYIRRADCEFIEYLRRLWIERGMTVPDPYTSEREDWVQAMVLAGLGFGEMPESSVALPGLLSRPLIEPEVQRTVRLLAPRGRARSLAAAAFLQAAAAYPWAAARHGDGLTPAAAIQRG